MKYLLCRDKATLLRSLMPMGMMVGKKMKTGTNEKMSLFYFLMQMEVNPSCPGHSIVRIFCGENFPNAYTWQIH